MPNKYPSIVNNKFDKKLYKKPITCPFCSSQNVTVLNTQSTLICPDFDNHKWRSCKCAVCNEDFIFETKSGEGWYTKDQFVLKGLPNCFENYILSCKCGGKIHRYHYTLDDKIIQQFYTVYKCDTCNCEESLDKNEVLNENNSRTK